MLINPQAIKLCEWMSQEDSDRVYDHLKEEEDLHETYQTIISKRRGKDKDKVKDIDWD
jgi:hypothetical protein